MKYAESICDLIGNTPLIKLNKIGKETSNNLYVKLESYNPGSSCKDRVAYQIITFLLKEKLIDEDTTLIEATSGNTGIGLAMICAYFNLKLIIIMSESVTKERIKLIKAYGAKVILTKKEEGIEGAIAKAYELANKIKNSYYINQFSNDLNPLVHYQTTAEEILKDLDNKVDIVVAGMGSTGTISGIAKKCKEINKEILIIGVEPKYSPFFSQHIVGSYNIPGIGSTFMPKIARLDLIDEIIGVKDEDAEDMVYQVAQKEGILIGLSSGAVTKAILDYLDLHKIKNKNIVLIYHDSIEKYLSIIK